ncbi:hypothetical protein [Natrinema sp. DC36]|uniref:hypothetical protein n=1 Tax=Natrinema sp. DC36 TaxID=2878680 RepID=UPI001CEFE385|nr:hypothetical protein [Natrinema sp. DC36]
METPSVLNGLSTSTSERNTETGSLSDNDTSGNYTEIEVSRQEILSLASGNAPSDNELPEWVSETSANEVELKSAERIDQPSARDYGVTTQSATPDAQWGFDFEFKGREFEATLSIYDRDDPLCNYGVSFSTGVYSATRKRIDCEGSRSLGVDLVVANLEVTIEPIDGIMFTNGVHLTGEVCVGGWRFEECGSLSYEFEY